MKLFKNLFLILTILTFSQSSFGTAIHKHNDSINKIENNLKPLSKTTSQVVYICTGNYAYAYHSRDNCPGMNNCKGEIKYTDEYTARNSFGRKACCRCWSNVTSNCTDDNPSYVSSGGGGSNDAYAYVAIVLVAGSAIVLSNDVYAYPIYSFKKYKEGLGWSFGFRKTFNKSALEYGVSIVKNNYNNIYGYNDYSDKPSETIWNLNYIHHIFYNKTPNWFTPYVGPSINYADDLGYGAIIGSKIKLFDRLDFDIRYEYTTETNQIQAGLIFTYQKKYFWTK